MSTTSIVAAPSDIAIFTRETPAEDIAAHFAARTRGLHVVVTGANTGIGFEAARVLAAHGGIVTVAARSADKGQAAVEKIKAAHPGADVSFMQLNLSSLAAVDTFADQYIASGKDLNVLINNAGIMACPYATTNDGYESQFAVNHLAHFHLTNRLLGVLERSARKPGAPSSRVVVLSSIANFILAPSEGINFDRLSDGPSTYRNWTRYGEAKIANILFAYELNKRLSATNQPVVAVSLHPGSVGGTELSRDLGLSDVLAALAQINKTKIGAALKEGRKKIPQGAATSVYCALTPDLHPGKYYKDCAVSSQTHHLAYNDDLSRRLWDVSESMVNAALEKTKAK
ncbi:hypothetical protein HK405_004376 [Cladochytrium tenue]|nr:hypothetical protein HK405_004376 [Cladochytrium tenue]